MAIPGQICSVQNFDGVETQLSVFDFWVLDCWEWISRLQGTPSWSTFAREWKPGAELQSSNQDGVDHTQFDPNITGKVKTRSNAQNSPSNQAISKYYASLLKRD